MRIQQLEGPELTERDYQAVSRLGAPFMIFDGDVSPFRREVAKRIAGINEMAGLPGDWPVHAADRARVRTEVVSIGPELELGKSHGAESRCAGSDLAMDGRAPARAEATPEAPR